MGLCIVLVQDLQISGEFRPNTGNVCSQLGVQHTTVTTHCPAGTAMIWQKAISNVSRHNLDNLVFVYGFQDLETHSFLISSN